MSDKVEARLMKAIQSDGGKRLRQILMRHEESFTTHAKKSEYTLENAKKAMMERKASIQKNLRTAAI